MHRVAQRETLRYCAPPRLAGSDPKWLSFAWYLNECKTIVASCLIVCDREDYSSIDIAKNTRHAYATNKTRKIWVIGTIGYKKVISKGKVERGTGMCNSSSELLGDREVVLMPPLLHSVTSKFRDGVKQVAAP